MVGDLNLITLLTWWKCSTLPTWCKKTPQNQGGTSLSLSLPPSPSPSLSLCVYIYIWPDSTLLWEVMEDWFAWSSLLLSTSMPNFFNCPLCLGHGIDMLRSHSYWASASASALRSNSPSARHHLYHKPQPGARLARLLEVNLAKICWRKLRKPDLGDIERGKKIQFNKTSKVSGCPCTMPQKFAWS